MPTSPKPLPRTAATAWACGFSLFAGGLFTLNAYVATARDPGIGPLLVTYLQQTIPWLAWAALVPVIFTVLAALRVAFRPFGSAIVIHVPLAMGASLLQALVNLGTLRVLGLGHWPELALDDAYLRLAALRLPTDWLSYLLIAAAFHVLVYIRRVRDLGQQRVEGVRSLAGGVAHELNNALTGISGLVEVLEGRLASRPRPPELEELRSMIRRCIRLGRDLQAVGEGVPMRLRDTTVAELVEILSLTLRTLGSPEIRIDGVQPPDYVMLRIDPERAAQAASDVILHLREAGGGGAETAISVEWEEATDRRSTVAIVVRSPAAGSFGREQPWLLERDGRVKLQLRLAAADGLVRQMGGSLEIREETGRAVFRLRLPATPDPGSGGSG